MEINKEGEQRLKLAEDLCYLNWGNIKGYTWDEVNKFHKALINIKTFCKEYGHQTD